MRTKRFVAGMILDCTGVELYPDSMTMNELESQESKTVVGKGFYFVIKNDRGNLSLMRIVTKSNYVNVPFELNGRLNYIATDTVYHVSDYDVKPDKFRGILTDDIISVKEFLEILTLMHWSHSREVLNLMHNYVENFYIKYAHLDAYEHRDRGSVKMPSYNVSSSYDVDCAKKYGGTVHIEHTVIAWKEQEELGREMYEREKRAKMNNQAQISRRNRV